MDQLASSLKLSLFAGNKQVAAQSDAMVHTPDKRGPKHSPMSHAHFYKTIRKQILAKQLPITQTVHVLTNADEQYFGMAEIHSTDETFVPVICWQSSHNQRVSAKLFVGAGVREFNNLVITTEIPVISRQVGDFDTRLPQQVGQALEQFGTLAKQQHDAFDLFVATKLVDMDAECCIVDMIRHKIITPSKALTVIEQWDNPSHKSLSKKNVWRLFNAVAHALKPVGNTDAVSALIERSPRVVLYCKELVMERLR